MKITVAKDDVKIVYEEPQKPTDYPKCINSKEAHDRVLAVLSHITEQVKSLLKDE